MTPLTTHEAADAASLSRWLLTAGLGGTEAVLTGLLVAQGATAAAALTITVLVRLLTLWLAVAIGLLSLLYSAAIRKEISFR